MHVLAFAVLMVAALAIATIVTVLISGFSWLLLAFIALAAVALQLGYLVVATVVVQRRHAAEDAARREAERDALDDHLPVDATRLGKC